jgi:hypothetical protein
MLVFLRDRAMTLVAAVALLVAGAWEMASRRKLRRSPKSPRSPRPPEEQLRPPKTPVPVEKPTHDKPSL